MSKIDKVPEQATSDAVDYRSGAPWDLGLAPEMLRRVAACTKARVARSEHWPAPQSA